MPLVLGSLWGHLDAVNVVLEHLKICNPEDYVAKVNQQKEDGYTALNLAALGGQVKVVRALLHSSASVNLGTFDANHVPLAAAAKNGHAAVVRALMQAKLVHLMGPVHRICSKALHHVYSHAVKVIADSIRPSDMHVCDCRWEQTSTSRKW